VPAQISVNDIFEAFNTRVVDGSMASIADLISFRLIEVVSHVTMMPLGLYQATSNFATNRDVWASLSVEDRAAMARAANRANADFTDRWGREMPVEAEAAARARGIEIIEADASLIAALEEFVASEAATAARIAQERFGFADAEARVARFLELYAKWEAIATEVDNDPAAMAERVWAEVWSQVDFAAYGL
jgi:TRAP-type transport system periplasmic protein